jgi:hypothetical protein
MPILCNKFPDALSSVNSINYHRRGDHEKTAPAVASNLYYKVPKRQAYAARDIPAIGCMLW